ncbi:hypothetical protein DXA20_05800 [Roseburia sp. AM59-24XD]|nr:hypothetical protein DXA20_05800 [Roseburia sp. AM59-24XD]
MLAASGDFPNRIRLDVYTDNILTFCGRYISAGAFCLRKVVTGMLPEPAYLNCMYIFKNRSDTSFKFSIFNIFIILHIQNIL